MARKMTVDEMIDILSLIKNKKSLVIAAGHDKKTNMGTMDFVSSICLNGDAVQLTLEPLQEQIDQSNEVTHMDDVGVYVCDNCGEHAKEIRDIDHCKTCKPGESKKWEKYYSKKENQ